MRFRSPITLAAATAALVLLAAGATAFAATGTGSHSPAQGQKAGRGLLTVERGLFGTRLGPRSTCGPLPLKPPLGDPIAAAAGYLGLSVEKLGQELKGGTTLAQVASERGKSVAGLEQAIIDAAKADLDRSVAAGTITDAQEQQILSQLRSSLDDFVNGKGGLSIKIAGPSPDLLLGGLFTAAANYLGLSADQLQQELTSGKSLAEIATEHGKPVDGLKQALITAATADLEQKITDLVNQKGLPGPACAGQVAVSAGVALQAPGFGPLAIP